MSAIKDVWLYACVCIHHTVHTVEDVVDEDEDTLYHTFNEASLLYSEHIPHLTAFVTAFIVGAS